GGPGDIGPGPKPKPATQGRPKRLRTKRERDAAKFGPRPPPVGGSRPPWAPHRRLQPPLALCSPLGPPKPVVITQRRLCHRGLFNHEVKSLDVRRLLTPGPAGDGAPAPAPRAGEGAQLGGVPGEALRELVAGLASLLAGLGVFAARDLVSERRRGLVAVLRRHHRRGPPDLGVFLAHRTPAQPSGTARDPRGGNAPSPLPSRRRRRMRRGMKAGPPSPPRPSAQTLPPRDPPKPETPAPPDPLEPPSSGEPRPPGTPRLPPAPPGPPPDPLGAPWSPPGPPDPPEPPRSGAWSPAGPPRTPPDPSGTPPGP
uniref:Uncharacterized protein n=1 Tax=Geospiza parvula TaxID=87175 RepID=A0A8U8BMQ0_GEOPR